MERKNFTDDQKTFITDLEREVNEMITNFKKCTGSISSMKTNTYDDSLPIKRSTGEELIKLKNDASELFEMKPPNAFDINKLKKPNYLSLDEIEEHIKHFEKSYRRLECLKNNLVDQKSTCASPPLNEATVCSLVGENSLFRQVSPPAKNEEISSPDGNQRTLLDNESVFDFTLKDMATSSPLPKNCV